MVIEHLTPEERLELFQKDLQNLFKKHGVVIGGCGCCDSPYLELTDNDERIEQAATQWHKQDFYTDEDWDNKC